MSAGLGTRMGSLTKNIPKVMVPILGKPLLLRQVEQFKKHGVTEFFINLHYLPEVVKEYFGDGSKFGVHVTYSFEPTILGTAGGLKKFEDKLDDEFFLIYGDTFSLVDYSKMAMVWAKMPKNAIGMQRMARTDNYADADVAELGEAGIFVKIHTKPHTEKYANAYRMRGVFILRKRVLSYIPPNTVYEIGKQLLPDIVAHGEKFYSYECDDYSKGIDTAEKLKEVEDYFKANNIYEES